MKVYIGIINGKIPEHEPISLRDICDELGVPYNEAKKGKRTWKYPTHTILIKEMKKPKAKKSKKPTQYEKPLTTKGKYNFGELVGLAMSGNPKPKKD